MAMEQTLQTLLGLLLILLVSLALVSAVAILLLIELGWIVRLSARLYWRWRSSIHQPLQADAGPPALTAGTLPAAGSGVVRPGDDGSGGCHRGTGA
jgi:hypothetical protein